MIIAIDFDGTLVEHEYPCIGKEIPFAVNVCLYLQKQGHKLILLTMRSGKNLEEAVEWCKSKGINFWAVNENPEQKSWTDSPKVYASIYIDDAALGCPLINGDSQRRSYVDWQKVTILLEQLLKVI